MSKFIDAAGGKRPTAREPSELRFSLEEREDLERRAAGDSIRVSAEALGRSPSTVYRDVNANGGRNKYRSLVVDRAACRRALLPKRAKLSACRLRGVLERKLEAMRPSTTHSSSRAKDCHYNLLISACAISGRSGYCEAHHAEICSGDYLIRDNGL
ncbi:MAG: hypothetical protein WB507_11265 [Solirubrobacterales bacterium]